MNIVPIFYGLLALSFVLMCAAGYLALKAERVTFAFGTSVVAFLMMLTVWLFFTPWSFIDNYELGYKFNMSTGDITEFERKGYVAKVPVLESVHTIDLRPRQVCITGGAAGASTRVLNCKLVQFDPKGLDLFLEWHGRGDYEGNSLDELLKSYAYDGLGRSYPFLRVLRELKSEGDYDFTTGTPTVEPTATPVAEPVTAE